MIVNWPALVLLVAYAVAIGLSWSYLARRFGHHTVVLAIIWPLLAILLLVERAVVGFVRHFLKDGGVRR